MKYKFDIQPVDGKIGRMFFCTAEFNHKGKKKIATVGEHYYDKSEFNSEIKDTLISKINIEIEKFKANKLVEKY